MFRKLAPELFAKPSTDYEPGPAPEVRWIEVALLVVDDSYQREIGRRGAANVRYIADHFEWSKFAPVIVAAVEGGRFAIVDGQHRTTAALLRSIESVPCQIVKADRTQQAAAYSAVNGSITKTTSQQLYHAKLTARDSEAIEVQMVCEAAGVTIMRRNAVLAKMKVGETQAIGAIARCLRHYGRDTLITAMQCITQTSDGNAGFVRATIIEGLCIALHTELEWRDAGDRLLRAMDSFSFPDIWSKISDGHDKLFPSTVRTEIADRVRKHLKRKLPTLKAAA